MDQQEKFTREPSETADGRAVSQIVFVLIGMAIIVGGIWTLYMGNAPYHPQDEVTRESTPLIGS